MVAKGNKKVKAKSTLNAEESVGNAEASYQQLTRSDFAKCVFKRANSLFACQAMKLLDGSRLNIRMMVLSHTPPQFEGIAILILLGCGC